MKDDPIKLAASRAVRVVQRPLATESLIRTVDEVREIEEAIKELTDSYKYHIDKLKVLIKEYFSDLQSDESPIGAMRRLQIRNELLEFANK